MAAVATLAMASPGEPGEAALAFLEKVRDGKLNLEPGGDTALIPQTSEKKRREISRRLERLAGDLAGGPLEISQVKVDDDLGAVLVRKTGGFDPSRLQVFPVAVVRRGASWLAAPVPASFENTGVGYAASLRKRLLELEDWMLRQRTVDLEALRAQEAQRMRREIEKSLPAATFRGFSALQACERFLAACETGAGSDLHGLIGGISENLPSDWPLRIKAVEAAVAEETRLQRPWRLLVSKDVLRVIVHQEEDGETALFSIGCLDPSFQSNGSRFPRIELVHLDMVKSADGFWRINPPPAFLSGEETPGEENEDEDESGLDSDLREAFVQKLASLYPATPMASAELACQAVVSAMQNGGLQALMPLIKHDPNPVRAGDACSRAAFDWWQIREPGQVRSALILDFKEDGSNAAAIVQVFASANPDRFSPRVFYFEKTADGWLWNPDPTKKEEELFQEWESTGQEQWKNKWQDALLRDCPVIHEIPPSAGIPEEAVRALAQSLLTALRAGKIGEALGLTARLDAADSTAALIRNLGYELAGSAKDPREATVRDVYRGKVWSAAGVLGHPGGKPAFPLYPVVQTPHGPRILLEIDLRESGSRSRDFLNKTAIQRLARIHPDAAADLQEVFDSHRAAVEGDVER